MLTPLQSAQSTAAVSAMQSIVETLEKRRREEAEKASGQKNDDVLKQQQAHLRADSAAQQANARINEHFFGSNARGADTIAKMVSRFSDLLGVTQQDGETSRQFAQRLLDRVTLIDAIRLPAQGSELKVTVASLGTTTAAVKEAMSGPSDDATANLVARLALAAGMTQDEDETDIDFGQRLSNLLTRQRGQLPADLDALEEKSGLADLGLKARDLVAAIANPYGEEAQRVKDALADKAQEEKALTPEMRKVIARLEDTAKPKSIEDLKLERTHRDPTRVEDAETRKEREAAIHALEAGEKLEDVQDLQEAVGAAHDKAIKAETKGESGGRTDDPLDTIQLLASGAEAAQRTEKPSEKPGETRSGNVDAPAETTGEAVRNLDAASSAEQAEREDAKKAIFALRVDDNGIYDLITRQLVA